MLQIVRVVEKQAGMLNWGRVGALSKEAIGSDKMLLWKGCKIEMWLGTRGSLSWREDK